MSKTKTLFTMVTMALLVLLGSMGAAQAQEFSEVKLFTTPEPFAREGGKNEAAGSILLNINGSQAIQDATIMLHFSVPLAADIVAKGTEGEDGGVTVTGDTDATVTGMAENEDNEDNGTITIAPGTFQGHESAHPRRDVGCQRRRWSRYRDS